MSESRVTWATSMPILVFLGLSVLDLGPMYAKDVSQTSDRRQTASSLYAPPIKISFDLLLCLRPRRAEA